MNDAGLYVVFVVLGQVILLHEDHRVHHLDFLLHPLLPHRVLSPHFCLAVTLGDRRPGTQLPLPLLCWLLVGIGHCALPKLLLLGLWGHHVGLLWSK